MPAWRSHGHHAFTSQVPGLSQVLVSYDSGGARPCLEDDFIGLKVRSDSTPSGPTAPPPPHRAPS